ncbi:MAG: deoxyribodipyrimidine photo-lyase [Pseudomonadota bacterium]
MSTNDTQNPIIVWFRQDLRLHDNPALHHAAQTGKPVIALYIRDETSADIRIPGAASRWWLHHSLQSLSADLSALGVTLCLKTGPAADIIADVQRETHTDAIVWNRRYGEGEQAVDASIKGNFPGEAKSFSGIIMHEPSKVRTGSDKPYRVYTPFWKNFSGGEPPRKPYPKPKEINAFQGSLDSESLDDWHLLPTKPDWSGGIANVWQPGEAGAHARAAEFMQDHLDRYNEMRDLPAEDRTSRLSPHLHFGEVSPHQLWYRSYEKSNRPRSDSDREVFRKELVWREFSYHLLQEWPDLAEENFNRKFDTFEWREDEEALSAWKRGQTGYPIVDAGMRQLWQTGWMHNRVRMITGSFLVKHLLIDWRHGERHFWDCLVDADPASNPAQWQWVAGTGADASPYFRIFNPIMQAEKFDPTGAYIKKFVPELKDLPAKHLPAPWDAPLTVLRDAGVKLGDTYPRPIVDHPTARQRALDTLQASKETNEVG